MSNSRITVLALGAALVLAFGAGIGSAAGNGAFSGSAKPAVTRDHGRGHWYERACDVPRPGVASCEAQVVAAADGTPLATGTPPAAAFGPAQFHSAYNLPTTAPSAQTIGIVDAFDDPSIESDLANYSSYYGLPPCTTANGCFKKVNQSGGTLPPIKDPGWALEIALDVETAHAICQNCKILLVEATSATIANLYAAENEAVKLGATAISNSWLAGEYANETADDVNFNHPGVAITASSGDNGYGVGYPAASRYVTAVGGTTLALGAGGSYGGESAWSGSGSGCSAYEPKPAWQADTGCARRSVADVSADADPNTGAAVYNTVSYFGQTGWFQVGGTSLSSPLVASVYALTGNFGGPSAPYGHSGSLHDVTSGSNGTCTPPYLCTGGVGYDGPTGLGSPNGLGAFSGGSAPAPDFSLSAAPASQTVTAGGGTTYSVSVASTGGFSGSVALSASGLPAGVTAGFSPASTTTTSTLTITTSAAVAPASYPFTITGTSGSLTHSTTATLVVQAASPTGDFSLSATPASRTVTAGGGTTYSVSVASSRRLLGIGRAERERPAGRCDGGLQPGVDHDELDADDHDLGAGRPGELSVHDHRQEREPDSLDHGDSRRPGRVFDQRFLAQRVAGVPAGARRLQERLVHDHGRARERLHGLGHIERGSAAAPVQVRVRAESDDDHGQDDPDRPWWRLDLEHDHDHGHERRRLPLDDRHADSLTRECTSV